MAEIPKVVRHRLATAKPGEHPDANLLTAFAEQSLANRERDSVLTHLAQCSDCREIVFLAAPQVELKTETIPVRSAWLGWPALRWGALAACGVIVVAAVSLRDRAGHLSTFSSPSPEVAMKQPESPLDQKSQMAASLEKDQAENKSRGHVVRPDEKVFIVPPQTMARAKAPLNSAPAQIEADKRTASAGVVGGALRDEPMASAPVPAAKPAAPPPAQANEAVQVSSESAAVVMDSVQPTPGKAKEAVQGNLGYATANKLAKTEAAPAALSGAQIAYKKAIAPRWTLSADGTLQRSLDAGKSWKMIPVAANATLTAVAAMDSDIWVGGSHGALYHSTDAGDHWTQVVPAQAGQALTSNIIGIEFPDSLHGKITTANQEVWTTSDGGQSWQISR